MKCSLILQVIRTAKYNPFPASVLVSLLEIKTGLSQPPNIPTRVELPACVNLVVLLTSLGTSRGCPEWPLAIASLQQKTLLRISCPYGYYFLYGIFSNFCDLC